MKTQLLFQTYIFVLSEGLTASSSIQSVSIFTWQLTSALWLVHQRARATTDGNIHSWPPVQSVDRFLTVGAGNKMQRWTRWTRWRVDGDPWGIGGEEQDRRAYFTAPSGHMAVPPVPPLVRAPQRGHWGRRQEVNTHLGFAEKTVQNWTFLASEGGLINQDGWELLLLLPCRGLVFSFSCAEQHAVAAFCLFRFIASFSLSLCLQYLISEILRNASRTPASHPSHLNF